MRRRIQWGLIARTDDLACLLINYELRFLRVALLLPAEVFPLFF
jgi:hypothetical protein